MPIEIKELHIKITIEEEQVAFKSVVGVDTFQLEAIKASIIRECTEKVMEKLKDREER